MMKKLLVILLIAITISCSSDGPEEIIIQSSPTVEELRKELSDSLINTFRGVIENPESLSKVTAIVDSDVTVLAGASKNNLWIGIFQSPNDKITEESFSFEGQINNHLIHGESVTVIDDEFFFNAYLVHSNYESSISDFPFHRFFFKYDIEEGDLKAFNQNFEEGKGNSIESIQRGYEDSYLVSTIGYLYSQGSNDIIYLDSNFENSEVWENNARCLSEVNGVTFITNNLYFKFYDILMIRGGNLSDCSRWTIDVWEDVLSDGGCVGCNVSVEFISESNGNLSFEVSRQEVQRVIIIDSQNGKIISNEVID